MLGLPPCPGCPGTFLKTFSRVRAHMRLLVWFFTRTSRTGPKSLMDKGFPPSR